MKVRVSNYLPLLFERQDQIDQVPVRLRLAAHQAAVNLDHVLYKMKPVPTPRLRTAACAEALFEDTIA